METVIVQMRGSLSWNFLGTRTELKKVSASTDRFDIERKGIREMFCAIFG